MADLCPNCTWQEVPNLVKTSNVKSYTLITRCPACQTIQDQTNAQALEEDEREEVANMISEKSYELAAEELVKTNKLKKEGNEYKKK